MDEQIRVEYEYWWTWKFLNQQRKICGLKNSRIRVKGVLIHSYTVYSSSIHSRCEFSIGVWPLSSITAGVNSLCTECTVPVVTKTRNDPQRSTTTKQRSTTIHNDPQRSTTTHNDPQRSTTTHKSYLSFSLVSVAFAAVFRPAVAL